VGGGRSRPLDDQSAALLHEASHGSLIARQGTAGDASATGSIARGGSLGVFGVGRAPLRVDLRLAADGLINSARLVARLDRLARAEDLVGGGLAHPVSLEGGVGDAGGRRLLREGGERRRGGELRERGTAVDVHAEVEGRREGDEHSDEERR